MCFFYQIRRFQNRIYVQNQNFQKGSNITRKNLKNIICRNLLGQKPSKTRYSNKNIFSLWNPKQTILKSRVIYIYRTTTLLQDPTCEKTVLNKRICPIQTFHEEHLELLLSKSDNSKIRLIYTYKTTTLMKYPTREKLF